MKQEQFLITLLVVASLFMSNAVKAEPAASISLIIDDMGYDLATGQRALALPGNIAYSFLPDTPHAIRLSQHAHRQGSNVLLHLPMQAIGDGENHQMGLQLGMSRQRFEKKLHQYLAYLPHIDGVNHHRGSLLSQYETRMQWLMETLSQHKSLFYVDSRTTHLSVAASVAESQHLPFIKRDVFLDHQRNFADLSHQWQRLLKMAQQNGHAVAIGHPNPETLEFLEKSIPALQNKGIRLVSLKQALVKRSPQWQAFLYP